MNLDKELSISEWDFDRLLANTMNEISVKFHILIFTLN